MTVRSIMSYSHISGLERAVATIALEAKIALYIRYSDTQILILRYFIMLLNMEVSMISGNQYINTAIHYSSGNIVLDSGRYFALFELLLP